MTAITSADLLADRDAEEVRQALMSSRGPGRWLSTPAARDLAHWAAPMQDDDPGELRWANSILLGALGPDPASRTVAEPVLARADPRSTMSYLQRSAWMSDDQVREHVYPMVTAPAGDWEYAQFHLENLLEDRPALYDPGFARPTALIMAAAAHGAHGARHPGWLEVLTDDRVKDWPSYNHLIKLRLVLLANPHADTPVLEAARSPQVSDPNVSALYTRRMALHPAAVTEWDTVQAKDVQLWLGTRLSGNEVEEFFADPFQAPWTHVDTPHAYRYPHRSRTPLLQPHWHHDAAALLSSPHLHPAAARRLLNLLPYLYNRHPQALPTVADAVDACAARADMELPGELATALGRVDGPTLHADPQALQLPPVLFGPGPQMPARTLVLAAVRDLGEDPAAWLDLAQRLDAAPAPTAEHLSAARAQQVASLLADSRQARTPTGGPPPPAAVRRSTDAAHRAPARPGADRPAGPRP